MKIKVGDILFKGELSITITKITSNGVIFYIPNSDNYISDTYLKVLQVLEYKLLHKVPNNELSKVLYPDYKVDGEFLVKEIPAKDCWL